uniref:Uncharacterized protein n=1 Tax=Romanomermis culicivorax TaxID=13658 RepID=A0A915JMU4_ROMCU
MPTVRTFDPDGIRVFDHSENISGYRVKRLTSDGPGHVRLLKVQRRGKQHEAMRILTIMWNECCHDTLRIGTATAKKNVFEHKIMLFFMRFEDYNSRKLQSVKASFVIAKRNCILLTRKQSSIQGYYFVIILSYFVPLYVILMDCEPSHTIFQDQLRRWRRWHVFEIGLNFPRPVQLYDPRVQQFDIFVGRYTQAWCQTLVDHILQGRPTVFDHEINFQRRNFAHTLISIKKVIIKFSGFEAGSMYMSAFNWTAKRDLSCSKTKDGGSMVEISKATHL